MRFMLTFLEIALESIFFIIHIMNKQIDDYNYYKFIIWVNVSK